MTTNGNSNGSRNPYGNCNGKRNGNRNRYGCGKRHSGSGNRYAAD
jgi:hypothetical protein